VPSISSEKTEAVDDDTQESLTGIAEGCSLDAASITLLHDDGPSGVYPHSPEDGGDTPVMDNKPETVRKRRKEKKLSVVLADHGSGA
jgi:hypothetical protein